MAPASQKGRAVTGKCQNDFFCGLHFLVGLADQAQTCLKLWENILLKGQDIGSLVHGGYSYIAMVNLEHSISSEWFVRPFHTEVAKNKEELHLLNFAWKKNIYFLSQSMIF